MPTTNTALDPALLNQLDEYIASLPTAKGALIQILHRAQSLFGYLSADLQLHIARKLDIPGAMVYGIVSFYSYFTMKPPGKHTISVCMGTACFVRGAGDILKCLQDKLGIQSDQITPDGLFTLKEVRCIGACGLAPVVMVDDKVYGRVKTDEIDTILHSYIKEIRDEQTV